MKFSIIIPVYNIDNYIGKMIDTILMQSFTDYEVIIVNDGSKDDSEKIIKNKIINKNNFRLITQDNAGPGAARNTGIRAARGEYILFWDGDDFITDKDALKRLDIISNELKFDILLYPIQHSTFQGDNIIASNVAYEKIMHGINKYNQVMNTMFCNGMMLSSPFEMLFTRRFIIDNKLYFAEGVFSEDIEWIVRIMDLAPQFAFSDYQFYCYRWNRPGSTCNSNQDVGKISAIIDFIKCHYKRLRSRDNETAFLTMNYLAYHWCVVASKVAELPSGKEKENCWNKLEEIKDILSYRKIKKVLIFSLFSRIIGIRNTALLGRIRYILMRRFFIK